MLKTTLKFHDDSLINVVDETEALGVYFKLVLRPERGDLKNNELPYFLKNYPLKNLVPGIFII